MDILETITAAKRREVALQKQAVSVEMVMKSGEASLMHHPNSMRQALASSTSGIIAEFKRRSPSKGWLHEQARVEEVVPAYERGGASACSILTDQPFFGGVLADLQQARQCSTLPLLRKDFVVDDYQLYQARAAGASAVLLIASVLSRNECARLARLAHELELEVLLEVHTEQELGHLNECVDMLGVNNRNLGTFHTDVANSFRLMEVLQHDCGAGAPLWVSESGISSVETLLQLREVGFRGFLMGEAFMKHDTPGVALAHFIDELHQRQS
jgi:indole-3-glycerol phosphate synthase